MTTSAPQTLKVYRYPHVDLPRYAMPGDAGIDLRADGSHLVTAKYPERIPTGVHVRVPDGHVGLLLGRSGLATRGLHVHPGTIDSGYTGELVVICHALGESIDVRGGERIAQLLIVPCVRAEVIEVSAPQDLGTTERGERGFGSTGQLKFPSEGTEE